VGAQAWERELTTDVGTPTGEAAASTRRISLAGIALTVTLAVGIFAPILYYMVLHWRAVPDYSHGFLVGPLALYFAWERREKLRRAPIESSWWGVLPLALGTLALTIGRLGVELMAMRTAFVLTLIGLVLLLLGWPIFRILRFPLLFLFLMVPLPQSLVNVIAFPLQLIAADMAVGWLHWLEIPALREGNIIHLANTPLFVAEACSGLRSLMALGTLAVVFAYFFRKRAVERIVIVLSAIPIAILVNAFRVALTGYLTHNLGEKAAQGLIHQTEGLFTFGLAFALLLLEAWLLQVVWPSGGRRPKPIGVRT
jgi:exosortase